MAAQRKADFQPVVLFGHGSSSELCQLTDKGVKSMVTRFVIIARQVDHSKIQQAPPND
jgi:hypothetical protein